MSSNYLSKALTIVSRLTVGGAFALAGWAKCVDPYGTIYKLQEYAAAMAGWNAVPREPLLMGAVGMGVAEFAVGVCLLLGLLRHSAAIAAAAIMAVMLPLSAWIWLADPVADCGCFGDVLLLSNGATFAKNIVLAAGVAWLVRHNNDMRGLFSRSTHWLVLALTLVYALVLATVGYNVQPVADFRAYPLGTDMADEDADLYLPAFDAEGEEALPWLEEGEQLVYVVAEPDEEVLTRSRYANDLARYARARGVQVAALVGTSPKGLSQWRLLANPDFPTYCADDTDLKALVRGTIGAVYLRDGRVQWKRTLASLPADLPDDTSAANALRTIPATSDGHLALTLTAGYLAALLLLALYGALRRRPVKKA